MKKIEAAQGGTLNLAHYRMGDSLLESLNPVLCNLTEPVVSLSLKDNGLSKRGGKVLLPMALALNYV